MTLACLCGTVIWFYYRFITIYNGRTQHTKVYTHKIRYKPATSSTLNACNTRVTRTKFMCVYAFIRIDTCVAGLTHVVSL